MSPMLSLAKKELKAYFGSPMAAIFIGVFLLSALFSFFWVETFFARNIADIRPLFRWMPLLLIFLVSALTMRQWSEEQKMGTLEVLLTMPVKLSRLVLGKFLAVLALVAIALALTGGLPVTVACMGALDWGPVVGGYVGAMLMASAYIAIGLYVSSRTDNQIVALILSVLLSGLLYLVGSDGITVFFGSNAGEVLRAVGIGSRFASIERGVIDLRDVVYYLTLAGFFLTLNTVSLDRKRWSSGPHTVRYRRNMVLATVLLAANLLAVNLWLNNNHAMRLDLTEGHEYSIAPVTRDLLASLDEPLLIRGYFSEKTHPLLAPLIPRIRDLLAEYKVAAGGKVDISFVDPKYDEELESEANQMYGIKPVPFQVAGRYEASVVNSYFHLLIKYGDQYVTLSYNDLIEVRNRTDGQLEVGLRNLEYDITKSIKKVVYGFQSLDAVFATIKEPVDLVAVVSGEELPEAFAELPGRIRTVAGALAKESGGKLRYQEIDPDRAANPDRQAVREQYGVEPLALSFLAEKSFYLHLLLKVGAQIDHLRLRGDMSEADLRREVEAVLKRHGTGFMKTVAFWAPSAMPAELARMRQAPQDQYQSLRQVLAESYNVVNADLADGHVAGDIDVLLLASPQGFTDKERLAVDQFLMRGGAVVALAGCYSLDLNQSSQALQVKEISGGIEKLLAHYGVAVDHAMVMDSRNEPFPVPVNRDLGGFTVQEIQQISYPFFVDVRDDGMDEESPVVSNLPAVTMNWVSPLTVDPDKNKGRTVTTLLRSSPDSWLHESTDIQPDFVRFPQQGFAQGKDRESHVLAVSVQGGFTSFYADKPDPRQVKEEEVIPAEGGEAAAPEKPDQAAARVLPEPLLKQSPQSAKLVVVGSADFVNDTVFAISRSVGQDRYLNSLEFLQNIVDWVVADDDLLAIRSRGQHARLLAPMGRQAQTFWEWLNYGLALLALLAVSIYAGRRRRREAPMPLAPLES